MPFSSERGKAYIKSIVSRLPHDDILDVGAGCGTYGKMFPKSRKSGVEIWPAYLEKYELSKIYDELHIADIRQFVPSKRYDVAFAGDVLEHMTREEAVDVFNKLKLCADTVVISIPLGHYPQEEYEGNPYEAHVVDNWSDEDVRSTFGEPSYSKIDGEIGAYIYSKHKIKMKICVYAISKNEAEFVERFCESAKDADMILIADTGSTDDTVERARKAGATVHDICITPWRFDLARNASLALIPRDIDVCISLDLDEVLVPDWREEVERLWKEDTTRMRYLFDWSNDVVFYAEKIHARHGYFWHHPCHEYPVLDARVKENWAHTEKLLVIHKPDPTKSRGQYMDLLALSVKEDPHCPRNAFYYARELSFYGKWEEAIAGCQKYLAMPTATWDMERSYSYRVMGKCYTELKDFRQAERSFHAAASEAPNTREPWCELAMLMYKQYRWEECFAYSMRALGITERIRVYTCDPAVWGAYAHDLASIAAWNLGLHDVSLKQSKLAVEKEPNNQRLLDNLAFVTAGVESAKLAAE